MTSLPSGSGSVCFDTTALIHFNAVGQLSLLGEWFPRAFVPSVVMEEELRAPLANHPENQAILDAGWLESVTVDDPDGLRTVAEIHGRFGQKGRDRGESEVVTLCARHGWTAIMDDTNGQRAARDYGAPSCAILTMILCAAGQRLIGTREAWKLHGDIASSRGHGSRSALTAGSTHRAAFDECVRRFGAIAARRGLEWPHILGQRGLDGVVVKTRSEDL
jgi:predicted nucleic acid-binding protein